MSADPVLWNEHMQIMIEVGNMMISEKVGNIWRIRFIGCLATLRQKGNKKQTNTAQVFSTEFRSGHVMFEQKLT